MPQATPPTPAPTNIPAVQTLDLGGPNTGEEYLYTANAYWRGTGGEQDPTGYLAPRPAIQHEFGHALTGTAYQVHGAYYWSKNDTVYVVANDGTNAKLWRCTNSKTSSLTSVQALAAITEKRVGWAEWSYAGNTYLVLCTGAEAWYINTSHVATKISDADFPATHIPTPVVMDGYLFVAEANSQKIFNSAVADLTTWQASTYIAAEGDAGVIRALALHKNHVVALKENSIEFFKNAAIPSPNSPLLRVAERYQQVGCIHHQSFAQVGTHIYFVGKGATSVRPGLYKIEDFQATEAKQRGLSQWIKEVYAPQALTGTTNATLNIGSLDDQTYVFLAPYGASSSAPAVKSAAYHIDTDKVYFWGAASYDNASLTVPDFDCLWMLQTFQTSAFDSSSLSLGFVPARTFIDPDVATRPPWAFFDSSLHADVYQTQGGTVVYQPLWVALFMRHLPSGGLTYPSTVRRVSIDMAPLDNGEVAATAAESKVYLTTSTPGTSSIFSTAFSMYDATGAAYYNPTWWSVGRYHDLFMKIYWTVGGIPATGSVFDAGVNVRMCARSIAIDMTVLGGSARGASAT